MTPIFFPSAAAFGEWLAKHHSSHAELWVGFWKVGSGQPSLTWSESVDEALRFGWIDGVRKSVDAQRYAIRFTPRRPGSRWSQVNLRKIDVLRAAGRMHATGLEAWQRRDDVTDTAYSFERANPAALDAELLARFRAHAKAHAWFEAQPPGYKRLALHYVTSAKRPETRARRLDRLIADSAAGRRIGLLARDA